MLTGFQRHQRKKPTWRTPCFQGTHHVGLQMILPFGVGPNCNFSCLPNCVVEAFDPHGSFLNDFMLATTLGKARSNPVSRSDSASLLELHSFCLPNETRLYGTSGGLKRSQLRQKGSKVFLVTREVELRSIPETCLYENCRRNRICRLHSLGSV